MKLVTLGCSFTHKYNREIDKVWPELVADTYSADLINLGRSGRSNRHQVKELLYYIMANGPPDKVYWLMTEWDRTDTNTWISLRSINYQNEIDSGNLHVFKNVMGRWSGDRDKAKREMRVSEILARAIPTQYTIDSNIMMIVQVQEICKEFGIDLKIMQGVETFPYQFWEWYDKKKIAIEIISSEYCKLLDLNTIIGYPWIDIIGGFCLLNKPDWLHNYSLSPSDSHPSQKGHDYIADLFLGNVYHPLQN